MNMIFFSYNAAAAMLDAEKMMTNFSEIKLLLCFPITFFFKVLKYQRNKYRCFFTALEHPQRGKKKGVKFLWLLCYSNMVHTLMQKNNDLWTNEVTDGFPYKQTAIIFSTLWLWVPLPHLSMSMWSYLLDNIFVPFISLCGLKSEKTLELLIN